MHKQYSLKLPNFLNYENKAKRSLLHPKYTTKNPNFFFNCVINEEEQGGDKLFVLAVIQHLKS